MVFGYASSVLQCARLHMWGTGASGIPLYREQVTVGAEIGEEFSGVVGTEYLFVLMLRFPF